MYICEFIGEAMKIKRILLFLLLIPTILFSQNVSDLKQDMNMKTLREMSDKEIKSYWMQAQERGYTLNQIKTLARAQGASESDLIEFERRVIKIGETDLKEEDDDLVKTQNELTSIFGLKIDEKSEEEVDEPYSFVNLGVFYNINREKYIIKKHTKLLKFWISFNTYLRNIKTYILLFISCSNWHY